MVGGATASGPRDGLASVLGSSWTTPPLDSEASSTRFETVVFSRVSRPDSSEAIGACPTAVVEAGADSAASDADCDATTTDEDDPADADEAGAAGDATTTAVVVIEVAETVAVVIAETVAVVGLIGEFVGVGADAPEASTSRCPWPVVTVAAVTTATFVGDDTPLADKRPATTRFALGLPSPVTRS